VRVNPVLTGALSGAAVFALLTLAHAQAVLSVHDLRGNPKAYVGREVKVTGLAGQVKLVDKRVGAEFVSYAQFGLYEQDAKGRKTGYHVWISLPVSAFQGQPPTENSRVEITGVPKWPYQIAVIEQ
jgi:hypothetical protein